MNCSTIGLIFLLALLIWLIFYSWNKTYENFGGDGSLSSPGYYLITWDPPDNVKGQIDVTYNIKITDTRNGGVLDNKTGLTDTSYEFTDGLWDVKYDVAITATNGSGTGPAVSTDFTSGDGPFPAILDMELGLFSNGMSNTKWFVPGAKIWDQFYVVAGQGAPNPMCVAVNWDPSVNDTNIKRLQDGGDTKTTITGTYQSVSTKTTCNLMLGQSGINQTLIGDKSADNGMNGCISWIQIGGDNTACPKNSKAVTQITAGDKIDLTIQFSNSFGTKKIQKSFTVQSIIPHAPSNLNTAWKLT